MRTILATPPPRLKTDSSACDIQAALAAALASGEPLDVRDVLPAPARDHDFWGRDMLAGLFLQAIAQSLSGDDDDVLCEHLEPGDAVNDSLGFAASADDWDLAYDEFVAFCTTTLADAQGDGIGREALLDAIVGRFGAPAVAAYWKDDGLGRIVSGLALFHITTTYMQVLPDVEVDDDGDDDPNDPAVLD